MNILKNEVGKPETNIIPLISGYTLNSVCGNYMGNLDYYKYNVGSRKKSCLFNYILENLFILY